jgi:hypothetical protein
MRDPARSGAMLSLTASVATDPNDCVGGISEKDQHSFVQQSWKSRVAIIFARPAFSALTVARFIGSSTNMSGKKES